MREPSVLVRIAAALDVSFQSAFTATEKKLAKVREEMASLEKTDKALGSFKRLSLSLEKSRISLSKQEASFNKLNATMRTSGYATDVQSRRLSLLGNAIEATKHRIETKTKSLEKYKNTLHQAGLASDSFSSAEARITNSLNPLRIKEIGLLKERSRNEERQNLKNLFENKKADLLGTLFKTAVSGTAVLSYPVQYQHQMTRLLAASKDRSVLETPEKNKELAEDLSKMILSISAKLPFSPVSIAKESAELVQAGFSVDELEANLPSIFKIALATDSSAEDVATIMRAFKASFQLDAASPKEMNMLANSLAKTINMTAININDLLQSSAYLVDLPKSINMSLGDTLAIMGTLKERGIPRSIIGTSLVALIQRLAKTKTQEKLEPFHVKVDEKINGKRVFRPFISILEDLAKVMKNRGSAEKLGVLTDIFATEAGRSLRALIEDLNDEHGKLRDFAKNLRVIKQPKPGERHLELDYLDNMAEDLQKSPLNTLTRLMSTFAATLDKLFANIAPEFLTITNGLKNLLESFNVLIDKHPDIVKAITLIGGGFMGLSIAFKTLSLIKTATILASLGGLGALATSGVLLGLSALATTGYLIWQNWEKVSSVLKSVWEKTKSVVALINPGLLATQPFSARPILSNYLETYGKKEVLSVPKTSTSTSSVEDKRTYHFTMQLPPTKDPQSYAEAVEQIFSGTQTKSPLRPKPSAFFDADLF